MDGRLDSGISARNNFHHHFSHTKEVFYEACSGRHSSRGVTCGSGGIRWFRQDLSGNRSGPGGQGHHDRGSEGKDKWEIAKDANTKVKGNLKVGATVTIQYEMKATDIEVKTK